MTFKPDVTVAAVVERDGRFLLVEEHIGSHLVLNQPAGHLEDGENLVAAVIRETLEESAWHFAPSALIGIYLWKQPESGRSFLRVAVCGSVTHHEPQRRLDHGIERTLWLPRDQIVAKSARLRSPMVLRCIDDYLGGARHSLEVLQHLSLENAAVAVSG
ncbi:MAG TPA: NUDIX hydrolase [Steroidobacteraceae bacterium]|nr:NUDIX hydrolase [Steroidobacteraceae bacterium]